MKKYLAILMITTLVFTACSADEEPETVDSNEVIEETMEAEELETEAMPEEKADDMDSTEEAVEEEVMVEEPEDQVLEEEGEMSGLLELTLEELKQYDGSDGKPAYIAIDGKIYDVSVIPNWSGGSHNGFKAGNDLTEEMKEISPHGVSKLQFVDEVGIIVE